MRKTEHLHEFHMISLTLILFQEIPAEFVLPNTDPCFTDSVPSLYTYGGGYYGEKQKAQLYYLDPATYVGATIDSVRAVVFTTVSSMYLPIVRYNFDFDNNSFSWSYFGCK